MLDRIDVGPGFRDHPRREALERRLGPPGVLALLDLWAWAVEHRHDGDLAGLAGSDVEMIGRWTGTRGDLVGALIDVGLLVPTEAGLRLSAWSDPERAARRVRAGRAAAISRWMRRDAAAGPADATVCDPMRLDATTMRSDATACDPMRLDATGIVSHNDAKSLTKPALDGEGGEGGVRVCDLPLVADSTPAVVPDAEKIYDDDVDGSGEITTARAHVGGAVGSAPTGEPSSAGPGAADAAAPGDGRALELFATPSAAAAVPAGGRRAKSHPPPTLLPPEAFEALYARYPRKRGKQAGRKLFEREITDAGRLAAIHAALDVFLAEHAGREMEFVRHFDRFMRTWRDWERPDPERVRAEPGPAERAMDAALAARERLRLGRPEAGDREAVAAWEARRRGLDSS